jgi:hypothetical protein
LERIDQIWNRVQNNRGTVELYTIAAADDWLIPQESILVGDDEAHMAIIPNQGHALVSRSSQTAELIIKWLNQ